MRTGLWILGLAILLSTTAAAQIRVETIDGTHAGELVDITAKALKIKSKAGIRIIALDTIFNPSPRARASSWSAETDTTASWSAAARTSSKWTARAVVGSS